MSPVSKRVILLAAVSSLWGPVAAADGEATPATPATPATTAATATTTTVTAPVTPPVTAPATPELTPAVVEEIDCTNLSKEDCELLKSAEAVPIFDERPDKPFDRDTVTRLTGEQAIQRGAVDLATALALIPDVIVQPAGRGGAKIDIRGASKGEVSILIDGVVVSDPYYGTFDLTSIPITDIVEIRVSTTPQSPIDGPGGPGGVIEVHTRDAVGPQIVIARVTSSSLPTVGVTGGARAMITDHLGLRVAVASLTGGRDLTIGAPFGTIGENRRDSSGLGRLEYRNGELRVVFDGFVDDRHYVVPPGETSAAFLLVDRETNARTSVKLDDKIDGYQIQAQSWAHYLYRRSLNFVDPNAMTAGGLEDLSANREGGMVLVTHAIGKEARWVASANLDRDAANVHGLSGAPSYGDISVLEAAGDLQYEHRTLRLDGAVGAALPFGLDGGPWPEAKLVARWRPQFGHLELTATGGRKGRVPSVRERYAIGQGNPALTPEQADHAEVRAIANVDERLHVEVAPFYRRVYGLINPSTTPGDMGKFINFPLIDMHGVDVLGRVQVHPMVEVGGAYDYILASSAASEDPLSHLPHNRAEGWVQVAPRAGFAALARLSYYGESFNQAYKLPAFTALELNASWQVNRKYLVVLHGDDLLNSRPEILPHVFAPGRVVSVVLQGTWD